MNVAVRFPIKFRAQHWLNRNENVQNKIICQCNVLLWDVFHLKKEKNFPLKMKWGVSLLNLGQDSGMVCCWLSRPNKKGPFDLPEKQHCVHCCLWLSAYSRACLHGCITFPLFCVWDKSLQFLAKQDWEFEIVFGNLTNSPRWPKWNFGLSQFLPALEE